MASSAMQMTVDLGSLTNMVANIGSRGLKQLATSGVQLHSLGCMVMIAELVPASTECRRTLTRVRERQRSERFWYFKVVEIGAASNFLADQLLKSRAGENVVALLASIVPVMSETSCVSVLSLLFETAGVTLENTPGLSEFEKIRDALLPLVRETDFKEKVLHYQYLLQALESSNCLDNPDPYDAIPHDKDIPKIIQMLFKVASKQDCIMTYNGISGAGWVAAYASYILGLETCAINASGHTLPINGNFSGAKVILRVSSEDSVHFYELSLAGVIEEFVNLEPLTDLVRSGWSINCLNLNFLETNHAELEKSPSFLAICEFVAVETMNRISDLAIASVGKHTISNEESFFPIKNIQYPPQRGGLHPYALSVLPDLCKRGLQILEILGFRLPVDDLIFKAGVHPFRQYCMGYACSPLLIDSVDPDCEAALELFFGRVGKEAKHYVGERDQEHLVKIRVKMLTKYVSTEASTQNCQEEDEFNSWSAETQQHVSRTLGNAADIAARMAFTDWATSIRLLSVRRFYSKALIWNVKHQEDNFVDSLLLSVIPICTDSFQATTSAREFVRLNWAALDFDGLIVLRSAVVNRSLEELRGAYLQFRSGRITSGESHAESIQVDVGDSLRPVSSDIVQSPNTDAHLSSFGPELAPNSMLEIDIPEVTQIFRARKNVLRMRLECLGSAGRWLNINPIKVSQGLHELWITQPCSHGLEVPLTIHGGEDHGNLHCKPITISTWTTGLTFDTQRPAEQQFDYGGDVNVFYIQFKAGPDSTWFSCLRTFGWDKEILKSFGPRGAAFPGIKIMQKDTCLVCTMHQVHMLCTSSIYDIRLLWIIRFRYDTEDMVDQTSHATNFRKCQDFNSFHYRGLGREKTQGTLCPGIDHTPCCIQGYCQPSGEKTRKSEKEESEKTVQSIPCIACVPLMCRRKQCDRCKELCLSQRDILSKHI